MNSKQALIRTVLGVSLSVAIALTGGLGFSPGQAQAAAKVTASPSTQAQANRIISTGERFLGVPYQFGARAGRTDIFDCSSFTQYVFKKNGVYLPRSSKQQARVGRYVSQSQLQPGDLVFYSISSKPGINHVAIYAGNGKLLHTYGRPGVTYTNMNSGWWKAHYITARRVLN